MAKLKDNSRNFVARFNTCCIIFKLCFIQIFIYDENLNIFVCLRSMPQNIQIFTLISIDIAQKLHSKFVFYEIDTSFLFMNYFHQNT